MLALLLAAALGQPPREFKAVQELRLDGHEQDFVPIGWIGVRRDGVVAISQTQDARYLFFDVAGRRIAEFGKKGSGPREFRWAPHASWIGDSLAAIDYDLERVTVLTPKLQYARSIRVPRIRPSARDSANYPRVFVDFMPPDQEDARHCAAQRRRRNHHETATGRTLDRSVPYTPVPIPQTRIDSALNRMIGRHALGTNRSVVAELKKRMPRHYNPVAELFVGLDDRIWIGMPAAASTREWLILDPQGNLAGRLVTPRHVTLKTADQSRAWGFEVDEFDVQSVVRYRITEK